MPEPEVSPSNEGSQSAEVSTQTPDPSTEKVVSNDPIGLAEESMVTLPGQSKAVKFGDWHREFQSNFTRAAQERAQAQKELAELRGWREGAEAELNRYRQAHQPPDPSIERTKAMGQLLNKLRGQSYLKGSEAADLVEAIREELGGVGQGSTRQLMALRLLAKQNQDLQKSVQALNKQQVESQHQARLGKVRTELGIPEELTEWLDDVYRAYEPGEALDREFPNIAKQRWEQIQNAYKAMEKARIDEARKGLKLPGKGGTGIPSKELDFAGKTPDEIADALFPLVSGTGDPNT